MIFLKVRSEHCPKQFEIVGNEYSLGLDMCRGYVYGRRMYSRIFVRRICK